MDFELYKKLSRIRFLMDENPAKAKQLVTDLINKYEQSHFTEED